MLIKGKWVPGLSRPGLQSVGAEIPRGGQLSSCRVFSEGPPFEIAPGSSGRVQHCWSKANSHLPQGLSHREVSYPAFLTLEFHSLYFFSLWYDISAF